MRILYFLLLIIIFISCDHPKKPYIEELTWPKRTVKLDNDLGVLTFRLPKEFDTFFKFDYISDHTCGDYTKYSFQNSSHQIIKDSGEWIENMEVDSMYGLTISHPIDSCSLGINMGKIWLTEVIDRHFEILLAEDSSKVPELQLHEITHINERVFYIYAWRNSYVKHLKKPQDYKSSHFRACTRLNTGYILYLDFDCATSNCDSFIPIMYKALKTVEIKPN